MQLFAEGLINFRTCPPGEPPALGIVFFVKQNRKLRLIPIERPYHPAWTPTKP